MFQINRIGCAYKESKSFVIDRPDGTEDYLFLIFLNDIYIGQNNQLNHYKKGTCLLYTPNQTQYYKNPYTGFENDWIHFTSDDGNDFFDTIQLPLNTPLELDAYHLIPQYIRRIEKETWMEDIGASQMSDLLIRELLIQVARLNQKEDSLKAESNTEVLFRQTRSSILSNPAHPWSIEEMAALTNLSRSRFSHIYADIFGVSPKEDLMRARMDLAKFLLSNDSYTISDIAEKIGYVGIYHFSKQFKKMRPFSLRLS